MPESGATVPVAFWLPPQAASDLTKAYADIAAALGRVSDKKMDAAERVRLLVETQAKEAEAIKKVAAVAAALRSSTRT
ncbi:MAG: hypothetical protein FJ279_09030 [Planctomycetes bacterium]|nr:hypothetical protein [Deltaproteobacteria bacterium]MBM4045243.1 hypothetical protein [Planctomycetota bacterium]MBM4087130.1 hypothetical protein [Planctomycetota bacterium]